MRVCVCVKIDTITNFPQAFPSYIVGMKSVAFAVISYKFPHRRDNAAHDELHSVW